MKIKYKDNGIAYSVNVEIGKRYYTRQLDCFFYLIIPKDKHHAYCVRIYIGGVNELEICDLDSCINNWANWIRNGIQITETEFFEAYEKVSNILLPVKNIVVEE
jgi:hypothetical protein